MSRSSSSSPPVASRTAGRFPRFQRRDRPSDQPSEPDRLGSPASINLPKPVPRRKAVASTTPLGVNVLFEPYGNLGNNSRTHFRFLSESRSGRRSVGRMSAIFQISERQSRIHPTEISRSVRNLSGALTEKGLVCRAKPTRAAPDSIFGRIPLRVIFRALLLPVSCAAGHIFDCPVNRVSVEFGPAGRKVLVLPRDVILIVGPLAFAPVFGDFPFSLLP